MPGLHISLGLYQKFYNMMEDERFQLDVKLATEIAKINKNVNADSNYQEFIAKCQEYANLESDIGKISDELQVLNDAIYLQILNNPDHEDMIKQIYDGRLLELQTDLNEKVKF